MRQIPVILPDGRSFPIDALALIDPSTGDATGSVASPLRSLVVAARATTTISIPSGNSVSSVADLGNSSLVGFIAPAQWTAAALNIEVSVDNTNWVTSGLFDSTGVASGNYPSLVVGAAYGVDVQTLLPFRYIRLRSGTAASPVTQGAQRDFVLITRPLA